MKRTKLALTMLAVGLLAGSGISYAVLHLLTVNVTISVAAPPLSPQSVAVGSTSCPISAGIATCPGLPSVYQGSSVGVVITLTNPSTQTYTVSSTTAIPGACTGISATDSTVTILGGQTGTLTVTLSASPSASPLLLCSIQIGVNQA
ncbi:MAG: hypothetical protein KGI38_11500 [Thaumarchaeota archaeon]|nr:hypothetical protein [Nitrososphaerota archaeon]